MYATPFSSEPIVTKESLVFFDSPQVCSLDFLYAYSYETPCPLCLSQRNNTLWSRGVADKPDGEAGATVPLEFVVTDMDVSGPLEYCPFGSRLLARTLMP